MRVCSDEARSMRVAMIGTGLQARRRAAVIVNSSADSLEIVASTDEARARNFARDQSRPVVNLAAFIGGEGRALR